MVFDPYQNWLGIPPHEQPPNFYRLLGLVMFESNPDVIAQAADRQAFHVASFQSGPYMDSCQQIINELGMARACLLDPQQKASYDNYLLETVGHRAERTVASPPPPGQYSQGSFGQPAPVQQFSMPALVPVPDPMQGYRAPVAAPGGMMGNGGYPAYPTAPAMPTSLPMAMAAAFPQAAPSSVSSGNGSAAAIAPVMQHQRHADPPPPPPEEPSFVAPIGRRRLVRKKKDYTKEMVIGGLVLAGAAVLGIVFLTVNSGDTGKRHGLDILKDATEKESAVTSGASAEKDKKDKKDSKAKRDDKSKSDDKSSHDDKSNHSSGAAHKTSSPIEFGPPSDPDPPSKHKIQNNWKKRRNRRGMRPDEETVTPPPLDVSPPALETEPGGVIDGPAGRSGRGESDGSIKDAGEAVGIPPQEK